MHNSPKRSLFSNNRLDQLANHTQTLSKAVEVDESKELDSFLEHEHHAQKEVLQNEAIDIQPFGLDLEDVIDGTSR